MYKGTKYKKITKEEKFKNSKISKTRSLIQKVFSTLKQKHGLFRTKYLGMTKNKIYIFIISNFF